MINDINDSKIKISVIIPIYNTEKYIDKCIKSVVNQTYKNLEIILVDDGSTDNSMVKCNEWAQKDNRIKIIHQENRGAAAARNSGIEVSTGKYIAFVDSDDYLDNNMYEKMMDVNTRYDCEIVMCDCYKESNTEANLFSHNIRSGFYNKEQLKEEYYQTLLMTNNVNYPPTISNCVILFSSDLIMRNSLRYVEGMRFSEDLLFGAIAIYNADSFYYMKGEAMYHYVINPTSVTHTKYDDKWSLLKVLYGHIYQYFSKTVDYDFAKQINIVLLFFVYLSINSVLSSDLTHKGKKNEILKILNDEIVRKMFGELKLSLLDISWKQKIITICYKYKIGLSFLIRWL